MSLFASLSTETVTGLQAVGAGLIGGLMLGAGAHLSGFCTLAALESAIFGRNWHKLHIWGIVLGIAVLGTQLGDSLSLIDRSETLYHSIAWNPLGSVVGGLVFGYGMAMAGNCGFGALVRAGGGDIRSLVIVTVLGIASFVTLAGPLAYLRDQLFPLAVSTGGNAIDSSLYNWLQIPPEATAAIVSVALILWGLSHRGVRESPRIIIFAGLTGLSVAWSFAATTAIFNASLGANLVEGPSFTAPVGRTILYLMTSTGTLPSFSVGMVLGTLTGAFAASQITGAFRWEACDDPRELGRQMGGAVLMGIGGVVAMGCSIGQGISAVATLAWSGPVTLMAICIGAYFGLNSLLYRQEI